LSLNGNYKIFSNNKKQSKSRQWLKPRTACAWIWISSCISFVLKALKSSSIRGKPRFPPYPLPCYFAFYTSNNIPFTKGCDSYPCILYRENIYKAFSPLLLKQNLSRNKSQMIFLKNINPIV
jgi:hypothetical protein